MANRNTSGRSGDPGVRSSVRGRAQQPGNLGRGKEEGGPRRMTRRKEHGIRDETRGLRAATVQAEVPDDLESLASDGRAHMLLRLRPVGEARRGQVGRAAPVGPEKRVQRLEDATFPVEASAQGGLQPDIARDHTAQPRRP